MSLAPVLTIWGSLVSAYPEMPRWANTMPPLRGFRAQEKTTPYNFFILATSLTPAILRMSFMIRSRCLRS